MVEMQRKVVKRKMEQQGMMKMKGKWFPTVLQWCIYTSLLVSFENLVSV